MWLCIRLGCVAVVRVVVAGCREDKREVASGDRLGWETDLAVVKCSVFSQAQIPSAPRKEQTGPWREPEPGERDGPALCHWDASHSLLCIPSCFFPPAYMSK